MRRAVARTFLAFVCGMVLAASVANTSSTKSNSKTSTAGSKGTSSGQVHGRTRGRRYARRAPAPSYQLHPDPERYQQIQQALADRGYFKGQVNGQWSDDSVDALKRFQADQKLDPDGKINALSLIGLGLGPKHDGSSLASAPSAPAVVPPPTGPAPSAAPEQQHQP
jgi:peptidoglycan hydrolase-like protein with peptidoglycan-binding domain